jgi:phosphatidylglycerol---prolipoprotein diacylglyceryl transferase
MHPVMFRWKGITVHSYPFMQYLGLIAGVLAGNVAAHRTGLDPFKVFVASFLLMFPMLGGARVLFVAMNWREYRKEPSRIWKTTEGGAAQYGGILVGVPLSIPLLSAFGLPFGAFWDVGGITILTGMILTRIGCFMNGCCTGRPSHSWLGMTLPNHRGEWEKRIPTQLLEAGWALFILGTGLAIWNGLPFRGALFIYMAAGYATGRLLLESLREMTIPGRRFTIQHAISLLIITLSLAALTIRV